jgi:transcriptional regulator with XRE-family HTH domain
MTTTPQAPNLLPDSLDRQVGENVATMLFRAGMTQKQLAEVIGTSRPTLTRKIQGRGVWTLADIGRIARAFGLRPHHLIGDLPSYEEWCAIRDSNPEPAGLRPLARADLGLAA